LSRLPNLNKLFPRLPLRGKLATAFVAIAAVPLILVAALTVWITVDRLRETARRGLEHDLFSAVEDATRALSEVDRNLSFAAEDVSLLLSEGNYSASASVVRGLFRPASSLFRVRVISLEGDVVLEATPSALTVNPEQANGLFYLLRGKDIRRGEASYLPVEVRAEGLAGTPGSVPAMAVLHPVYDAGGRLQGILVGEALAARLFEGLTETQPLVPGTTFLADSTGLILFHSARKPDWKQLVISDEQLADTTAADLLAAAATATGRVTRVGASLAGFARIPLSSVAGAGHLTLVRYASLAEIYAPIGDFLRWTAVVGLLIVVAVAGLALVAASQLSEPVYRLSEAAGRLAAGDTPSPVLLETNDELEDLGNNFNRMATALDAHRRGLEALVLSRTQALEQAKARLSDVLAHSADGIVVLDHAGRIQLWNRGAERLFGWTAAEVLGQAASQFLASPNDGAAEAALLASGLAETGAVVNLPTRRLSREGKVIPVNLTQTAIGGSTAEGQGYSLIFRDNSMQERLEDQMKRSERLAAVSLMAAGLAHELNNPLAILGNRIEVMQAELLDEVHTGRIQRDLEVMQGHVARLSLVTRDLLRFAREEDDPLRPTDIGGIIGQTGKLLERTLVTRNVWLALDVPEDLPSPNARGREIETVLLNLLLNAADAMPAGGTVTVKVRPSEDPRGLAITVRDEGHGIPVELQGRIFEPFFTTKAPGRGTGLGLAVCRSIVESHGGWLTVASEPGKGSTFMVRLPLPPGALA